MANTNLAYELGHTILLFGAGMVALWVTGKAHDIFGNWPAAAIAGVAMLFTNMAVVVWLGG